MKAFILAAGLGTRLRPLTQNQPKVMVEVAGKKILEHTIELLKAAGVDDLVINTHYFPEVVPTFFGDGSKWGVKIQYSHEPEILGTAGGLKKAEDYFKNEKEFLVVYGDNMFDIDFAEFINLPQKYCATIMLFDREKNAHSGMAGGVVEVSAEGLVTGFHEGVSRPEISHVNGGVYKLTPEIFKYIPANTAYDFAREVFPDMLKKNVPFSGFVIKPHHAIFGGDTMESLELTRKYFSP